MLVNIMVAKNFIAPAERKEQITVNHIDNDRTNNHYTNLKWATQKEQAEHSYKTNLNRKKNNCNIKCEYKHKDSENWIECESIKNANEQTNVPLTSIYKVIDKEIVCKNYQFRSVIAKIDQNKILEQDNQDIKCEYKHKESENWVKCKSIKDASDQTLVSTWRIYRCMNKDKFTKKYRFRSIKAKIKPNDILKPVIYYIQIDNIEEFKRINNIDDSIETIFT